MTAREIGFFFGGMIAALTLASMTADAQLPPDVTVFGTPTAGNCVQWLNANTIEDAGKTC